MNKFFFTFFLILVLNFYSPTNATDQLKNYYKGKFYDSVKDFFLVASKTNRDPRFKNTVIIMFDNEEEGSWGLIVNKPLALVPLGSLIHKSRNTTSKQKELYNVKIPVYWGGPVNENKILILHSQEYKNETTKNFKNLSISSDYKILFEIADKKGPKKSLIILGISSWGPGQLEGEMEIEEWVLSEINTDLIFEKDNSKKWLNAINSSFIRL
jgi:putative transcriptional regulator|tara:strand:- start:562 stop:1197 length:636 start_codon:yes stop_codon:yes gene_type:complete